MFIFQIRGICSTYAPTQFGAAFYSTLTYYVSYLVGSRFSNMTSFYQCNAVVIQVLTNLLQLKFQGTDQTTTPFATNPTTMLVVVSSSTINYLASIALLHAPLRHFDVATRLCLLWSGYAAVASLAALLLPDQVAPFVYSIFALISAADVLYWCKLIMEEEEDVVLEALRRLLNNLFRAEANPNLRRPHILPLWTNSNQRAELL